MDENVIANDRRAVGASDSRVEMMYYPRQAQTCRNSMRHVISASLFVLSCALAQPASAQLEDKPVPMDKAPFHIPVFANDYLILLNVNIPPGRTTAYHIHYSDSASVT